MSDEVLHPDDAAAQGRSVFLGPPGYDLPFQFQYVTYGLYLLVFAVVLALLAAFFGLGPKVVVYAIVIAVLPTGLIMQRVDADRPVRAVVAASVAEIHRGRQRAPQPARPVVIRSSHVRILGDRL